MMFSNSPNDLDQPRNAPNVSYVKADRNGGEKKTDRTWDMSFGEEEWMELEDNTMMNTGVDGDAPAQQRVRQQ